MRRSSLLVLLLLAGCSGATSPEATVISAAGGVNEAILGYESQRDQPVLLATRGVVDVHVETFAGSVRVEADPSVKESVVMVRRIGTHGWGRTDESMHSLGEIRSVVGLDRVEGVDTITVKASTEHPEPYFQNTEITIKVPDLGAVFIRTSRGDVWVQDNRGPLDVTTTRGAIRAMTPWRMDQPMTLVTSDGDVDLRLRGESKGWINAETVNGTIKSRVKHGKFLATDSVNDIDSLRAWLNDGTNPITLRTSNADVIISVVPDPVSSNPFAPMP